MEKEFLCGIFVGMVGGALLAANSYKTRKFVRDGTQQIKEKVSEMKRSAKKKEDYDDLTND